MFLGIWITLHVYIRPKAVGQKLSHRRFKSDEKPFWHLGGKKWANYSTVSLVILDVKYRLLITYTQTACRPGETFTNIFHDNEMSLDLITFHNLMNTF